MRAPGVLGVVDQVDAGRGAVVLARAVDRRRVAEPAGVLAHRLLGHRLRAPAPAPDRLAQEPLRVAPDHRLGQTVGLDEEEPVVVGRGEGLIRVREQGAGGDDVEHGRALHGGRVVQGHPVHDPAAAIVPGHREAREAEGRHRGDDVRRHGALGVGGVVLPARRLGALAVAAQVGRHHREAPGQGGGDAVPAGRASAGSRAAGAAAGPSPDVERATVVSADIDHPVSEAREHHRILSRRVPAISGRPAPTLRSHRARPTGIRDLGTAARGPGRRARRRSWPWPRPGRARS